MRIKDFIIDRAMRSTSQREAYEDRLANHESSDSILRHVEPVIVGVLNLRELGWQALHVTVSLPEIVLDGEQDATQRYRGDD